MDIQGSTFLVTGGASGLGAATARLLAGAGARVVIADLDAARGDALAKELGPAARFVRTDVADEASATAAVEAAVASGPLRGLVHCAGIVHGEKVVGRDGPHALASFARAVTVNLVGTFNLARLAATAMTRNEPNAEGERGVLVFTASIAAFDGQVGQAAYSASKAGVAGLTLPLARELGRHGIRVMTVAPGVFETPMMGQVPQEVADALARTVPFPPRFGRPAEFASLVAEIVRNPMLNGEVIRIDGAVRMAAK